MADEIGAMAYCECSALKHVGVYEVFEKAVRLTLYDSSGQLKTTSTNGDTSTKHVSNRSQTKSKPDCVLL